MDSPPIIHKNTDDSDIVASKSHKLPPTHNANDTLKSDRRQTPRLGEVRGEGGQADNLVVPTHETLKYSDDEVRAKGAAIKMSPTP